MRIKKNAAALNRQFKFITCGGEQARALSEGKVIEVRNIVVTRSGQSYALGQCLSVACGEWCKEGIKGARVRANGGMKLKMRIIRGEIDCPQAVIGEEWKKPCSRLEQ